MEDKTLTTSNSDKRVKTISYRLFMLQARFNKAKQEYEQEREKIQKQIREYISQNKLDGFRFSYDSINYSVKNVVQKKIIFDVDKLEKKLDKELLNEFVEKEYKITDWDNLVKYLKSCGVNPKEFKKFVKVEKTVNQKKLDELSKLGKVTAEDIDGCYEVVTNTGYIKISELE